MYTVGENLGFLCSYRIDNQSSEALSFGQFSEAILPNYRRKFMNLFLTT